MKMHYPCLLAFKNGPHQMKLWDSNLVAPSVNVGGVESWQLLAELLCPWLLGFCAAPSTYNTALSRTAANVHTCLHLWPYGRTETRVLERARARAHTHAVHTYTHYAHARTHTLGRREKSTLPLCCCGTCSQWANPAASLLSAHTVTLMHMYTYP